MRLLTIDPTGEVIASKKFTVACYPSYVGWLCRTNNIRVRRLLLTTVYACVKLCQLAFLSQWKGGCSMGIVYGRVIHIPAELSTTSGLLSTF